MQKRTFVRALSAVTLTLPLGLASRAFAQASATSRIALLTELVKTLGAGLALRDLRALLVDDNPTALEVLSHMVESFGLTIAQAASGQEAISAIHQADQAGQPYDLMLIDWKMPGMDGVSCLESLKREHISNLPAVVMVTA